MTRFLSKSMIAAGLAATALASATPAMAEPYRGQHQKDDTLKAALIGGLVGLAIGVIATSGDKDKHRRCDDRRYDDDRCYRGYDRTYQDGYYRDGSYRYDGRFENGRGYEDDAHYRYERRRY